MTLIDTHCHLNILSENIPNYIKKAEQRGVTTIINPATNAQSSRDIIEMSQEFKSVYAAIGIHPVTPEERSWQTLPTEEIQSIESLLNGHHCGLDLASKSIIAIGECGLDFKYAQTENEKKIQIQLLKQHLKWAQKCNLPIIIHNRSAVKELINIILNQVKGVTTKNKKLPSNHCSLNTDNCLSGVFHCFTGSKKLAKQIIQQLPTFYFGVGGLVTFDTGMMEVIKTIPLERIILETDAPYLTPKPIKDTNPWPNEPANTYYVAHKLAQLKQTSLEEIATITTQNTKNLFKLD